MSDAPPPPGWGQQPPGQGQQPGQGWGPPPPPQSQPPGQPPQGGYRPQPSPPLAYQYPAQQPYGGGPQGLPPQKKSRTGLIVGLIAGVVLVAVIGGALVAAPLFTSDPERQAGTVDRVVEGTSDPADPADPQGSAAPSADATTPEGGPTGVPLPTLQPFDGESGDPAGGSAGTVGQDQSVFELPVGTCFNNPGSEDEIQSVEVVGCTEPHDNEVFALTVFDAAEEEPFPGREALRDFGEQQCTGSLFTDYVGIEWRESRFFTNQFTPTEGSWEQGDREVVCLLFNEAEESEAGSARGAAQ